MKGVVRTFGEGERAGWGIGEEGGGDGNAAAEMRPAVRREEVHLGCVQIPSGHPRWRLDHPGE